MIQGRIVVGERGTEMLTESGIEPGERQVGVDGKMSAIRGIEGEGYGRSQAVGYGYSSGNHWPVAN